MTSNLLSEWDVTLRCPFKSCAWYCEDIGCAICKAVLALGVGKYGVCEYYEGK